MVYTNWQFYQRIAFDWCKRTFGSRIASSVHERSLRVVEEAIELAQSEGVDEALLHKLVSNIMARPKGKPFQEVGGVAVTLLIYCEQQHLDLEWCMQEELQRILGKDPQAFRDRMAQKEREGVSA